MRPLVACACAAALIAGGDAAHAEESRPFRVGVQLMRAPGGEISTDLEGYGDLADHGLEPAFGGSLYIDRAVTRGLSVGVQQRAMVPITLHRPGHSSGLQLDTMLRVSGHVPTPAGYDVAVHLLGGYSFLQVNEPLDVDGDAGFYPDEEVWCRGPIVGAATSAAYRLSPHLALRAEIGYTRGFQSTTVDVMAPQWGEPGPHRLALGTDMVYVAVGGEASF